MSDSTFFSVRTVQRAVALDLYRAMIAELGWMVFFLVVGVGSGMAIVVLLHASMIWHVGMLLLVFGLVCGYTYILSISDIFGYEAEPAEDDVPEETQVVLLRTYLRILNASLIGAFCALAADIIIVVSGITADYPLVGHSIAVVIPILVFMVPVLVVAFSRGK